MHAIRATLKTADSSLEDVYRDSNWRMARVTCPKLVLKLLGCLERLDKADFFAAHRILWVVERHGTLVGWMVQSDDDNEALIWKEPELIEIAACQRAWQLLPMRVQIPIWRRLLAIIRGYESVAHDRPEIRRLAEATFRARVDRAIEQNNHRLLEELATDCHFWRMGRAELLQQQPSELRRWYRILRLPKNDETEFGIEDFVRALRHAAGFLNATTDFED